MSTLCTQLSLRFEALQVAARGYDSMTGRRYNRLAALPISSVLLAWERRTVFGAVEAICSWPMVCSRCVIG